MNLFSGISADKSADASADALCMIIPLLHFNLHICESMNVKQKIVNKEIKYTCNQILVCVIYIFLK